MLAWGSPHLASQSNQVNLLPDLERITFGVDLELCGGRPNGDFGRNSRSDSLLGRFGRFLVLFAEQTFRQFHLCRWGWEETKVADPRSQTLTVMPLVGLVTLLRTEDK